MTSVRGTLSASRFLTFLRERGRIVAPRATPGRSESSDRYRDGTTTVRRVVAKRSMNAENTFEAPSTVSPAPFHAFTRRADSTLELEIPPKSLVTLSCGPVPCEPGSFPLPESECQ